MGRPPPTSFLVTTYHIHRLVRNQFPRKTVVCLSVSVLVLIGANVIACGAVPPAVLNSYHNLSSVYVGVHLYRLDMIMEGTLRDLDSVLLLWECDSIGWFCRVVYTKNYYSDMVPKLTGDPKTNTVSFIVNDKVVYVYTP